MVDRLDFINHATSKSPFNLFSIKDFFCVVITVTCVVNSCFHKDDKVTPLAFTSITLLDRFWIIDIYLSLFLTRHPSKADIRTRVLNICLLVLWVILMDFVIV